MIRFSSRVTQPITMIYRTGDSYVDGLFVPGAETTTTIEASVQRLSMAERQLLPEGFRTKKSIKLYTETATIQTLINDQASITDGAEFEVGGERYSMLAFEQWTYLIPHWKITAVVKT